MKSAIKFLSIILFALLVTGCSMFDKNSVNKIQVIAESKANYGSVTDVDFVFVYDGDSIALPSTNEEWFDVHNDLRFNGDVKVVSVRISPSLISEVQMPPQHFRATKVLAYVNFKKNGDQEPMDITNKRNPVLILKDDHYRLSRRR